jgi:hypothetical protein
LLDGVADAMREALLGRLAAGACFLAGPITKARPKPMHRCADADALQGIKQRRGADVPGGVSEAPNLIDLDVFRFQVACVFIVKGSTNLASIDPRGRLDVGSF